MSWVKKIILINIVVFGVFNLLTLTGLHLENLFALYPIDSDYFSPYQLITHLFVHGNTEHLFFNMLFLLLIGPEVEDFLKTKFIGFYLLSGLFSSGLYFLNSNGAIIGASGAIFSIICFSIFTTIKKENYKKSIYLKLRNIFFISFIISEIYVAINSSIVDNIGHWAHVFGSIFAIIYYFILNKKDLSENREV